MLLETLNTTIFSDLYSYHPYIHLLINVLVRTGVLCLSGALIRVALHVVPGCGYMSTLLYGTFVGYVYLIAANYFEAM